MLTFIWSHVSFAVYSGILFINVIASLGYFIASTASGADNSSAVTFGVSCLFLVLFTPCSFVCWYRPLYKAFRSDSSFNFFVFFFIFFFQFCVTILMCLGIDGWGTCGWINGLGMLNHDTAAAIIMIVVALLFSALAGLDIFMLIRVHRIYRSTGASFEKAQAEFAQGVMSNKNVQHAAASAGQAAAQGAVNNMAGGNRY